MTKYTSPLLMALLMCSASIAVHAQKQGAPSKPNAATVASDPSTVQTVMESSSAAPVEQPEAVQPATSPVEVRQTRRVRPFREYGTGFQMSSLGAGFQVATPLAQHFDLRAGTHFFSYNGVFEDQAWTYGAKLNLRSGHVQLDYMPFARRGFHISPGMLIYRNGGSADISIAPGKTFDMGDANYVSSVNDPVKGKATFEYKRQVAPMLTIGLNNLVPRGNRRWSIPVEIGGVYTGAPNFGLTMDGTVCETEGCGKISSDAGAMNDMKIQRQQVQDNLNSYARFYPIVSVGFAWNFGARR